MLWRTRAGQGWLNSNASAFHQTSIERTDSLNGLRLGTHSHKPKTPRTCCLPVFYDVDVNGIQTVVMKKGAEGRFCR